MPKPFEKLKKERDMKGYQWEVYSNHWGYCVVRMPKNLKRESIKEIVFQLNGDVLVR